ncbi:hypothetical protein [Deinococcus cellulosilyticus]|uniref:Uncharacterized protein n=1 Tax=Deinococcus cellulosilyticus (strain DSM 18568 / NBRC 106333 / KACC 11606 / 5516J-15) TaxID=1223518 RepID=A0A511MWA8_DEIC1|nr:hypothetical protein [Deinococcus cellulosilyticus]GEM44864.1 hypothetical protein DC3_04990 [Deinococcus cellulosilyticus NBRC 106333 = KACC 11606]
MFKPAVLFLTVFASLAAQVAVAKAPTEKITDPAKITRAYVESFGDVREWVDMTPMGNDERRCIFNSLQRMNTMVNYYLRGASTTNISFLRKDQEALTFNLTAEQPPIGAEKNKVRGFWISIRCADQVRNMESWKTVMSWVPVFEALVQNTESQLGYTFSHVEITPQGGNMLWWKDKKGNLVILR